MADTKMWEVALITTFEDCVIERNEFQGIGRIINTSILGIGWQRIEFLSTLVENLKCLLYFFSFRQLVLFIFT